MKNKIIEVRICHSTKYEVTFVRESKDNGPTEKTYTPNCYGRVSHINYLLSYGYSLYYAQVNNGAVVLHYEPKPARQEFFDVLRVSRDDFEMRGYDASKLSDETMQEIADDLGDNESSMEDFWVGIDFAAERFDVPKIKKIDREMTQVERDECAQQDYWWEDHKNM